MFGKREKWEERKSRKSMEKRKKKKKRVFVRREKSRE